MSSSRNQESKNQLIHQYENALSLLSSREFSQAREKFEQILNSNSNSALLYLKLGETFYFMGNYINAYTNIKLASSKYHENFKNDNFIEEFTNDPTIILTILSLKLKLDEKISPSGEISETIQNLNAYMVKFPEYSKLNEINEDIAKFSQIYLSKSPYAKLADKLKDEAYQVYELIEYTNKERLLSEEGLPVYIVSMQWFRKWKKYTQFFYFSGEKSENLDGLMESYETDDSESDVNLKKNKNYPGPINYDDDLLIKENVLFDNDPVKNYCNSVIKKGLEENRDFVILSHKVFKYLFKIYGGREIKRFVVNVNDENNLTHVEIWLKKINFFQILPIQNEKLESNYFYMSKKETIHYLKEKFIRINKPYLSDKLIFDKSRWKIWKIEGSASLNEIREKTRRFNDASITINATKLQDHLSLEESEISDLDTILVEYQYNEVFIFTSEAEKAELEKITCIFCRKESKKLMVCKCQMVKYCSNECYKNHYPSHQAFCKKNFEPIITNNSSFFLSKLDPETLKNSKNINQGLTGLQNLGNTCFMNSSLQCLSNCFELTKHFLNNEYLKEINRKNPLGTKGILANAYGDLIKELWLGKKEYISPWQIKKIVGKYCPQFSGYNQQDSQELLSYLLDGLHEDLNLVKKKPNTETIEYKNQLDEVLAKEMWNNYQKRNKSRIVDLFAGQYKSKLKCPKCQKVSITFDPFLSISLPIPHTNNLPFSFYFVFKNTALIPLKVKLLLSPNDTCESLVRVLSELMKINKDCIKILLIKEHKIIESPSKKSTIKYLDEHEGIVFVYEIFNEEINFPLKFSDPFIQLEVNVLQSIKKERELYKDISYCRLDRVHIDSTFKDLHLAIFRVFRIYLKNFYEVVDQGKKTFFSNEEKIDYEKEFKTLFLASDDLSEKPYKLVIPLEDNNLDIPFSEDKLNIIFQKEKEKRQNVLEINLIFPNTCKIEYLKLNKCQESNLNNQNLENKECSIYNCLEMFTAEEVLDQENAWYCSNCKDHKLASKKMEIYNVPDNLILHLKRFKTSRISSLGSYFYNSGSAKITKFVNFPIEGLDLTNYVKNNKNEKFIYDLYAISNHYGGISGGHYTAFCKNEVFKTWFEFNDSSVNEVNPEKIVNPGAYVLFYKRRKIEKDGEEGKII